MAAEGSLRLKAEWFGAVAAEGDVDAAKKVEAGHVWVAVIVVERAAEASGVA